MVDKLYYIENEGCVDITRGLVRISDKDFPKFKAFIENLNKNSTYGCMPIISVYKADISEFKELKESDINDNSVDSDYLLYLDGNTYTFLKSSDRWKNRERVI